MPATYTLIASTTLSVDTASVTFSSIPQTYTDLVLRGSVRGTANNTPYTVWIYPNNTQNLVASTTWVRGDGSTAYSSRLSGQAEMYFGVINSALRTSNTFGSLELYLPNYNSSSNKVGGAFSVEESNAQEAWISANATLWQDTTAISSIVVDSSGNFVAGSSFFLYGIKNS